MWFVAILQSAPNGSDVESQAWNGQEAAFRMFAV